MSKKELTTHTITAYKLEWYDNNWNPLDFENGVNIDIFKLCNDFIKSIEKVQTSVKSERTIYGNLKEKDMQDNEAKFKLDVHVGNFGYEREIYNHKTNAKSIVSKDDSVLGYYYVFMFLNKEYDKNMIIFHRYGLGGCKTTFVEMMTNFFRLKGVNFRLRPTILKSEVNEIKKSHPKTVLLSNYIVEQPKRDTASNVMKKQKKLHNYTLKVNVGIRNWNILKNVDDANAFSNDLNELLNEIIGGGVLTSDMFSEKQIVVSNSRRTRTISLDENGKAAPEYDVSDKIKYDSDTRLPLFSSMNKIVEEYYNRLLTEDTSTWK